MHEPSGELQSAARGGGELPTLQSNVEIFPYPAYLFSNSSILRSSLWPL